MSIIGSGNALLLASAAPAAAVTGVSRSLRFNSADSAYLNRTPSSAGNRRTWTWSGWVKRSNVSPSGYQSLFTATTAGDETLLYFDTSNRLRFYNYSGSTLADKVTTAVFRDPSAWYHIVLAWDTTNATAADRVRIYVNGVRETAFDTSTDAGSSEQSTINNTIAHMLGSYGAYAGNFFDGYLADVYFVDGQALSPSDFAEADATTGQWVPKEYTFSTPLTIEVGTPSYPSDFTTTGDKTSDQTGLSFGTWSGSYTGAETKIFKASDDSVFEFNLSLSGGSTDRYLWYSDDLNNWTYIGNTNPNRYYRLTGHKYYATSEGSSSTTLYAKSDGFASFHLNFSDNSGTSSTTLGKDAAGSNNWTPNNFSVASGSGNDSLVDVPLNGDQTDTGSGNEVRGNYCTWNPLTNGSYNTLSNGNLDVTGNTNANNGNTRSTIAFKTGKWYSEMTVSATAAGVYPTLGIILAEDATTPQNAGVPGQVGYPTNSVAYELSGVKRVANSTSSYGSSYTTGDVIGIAVDADNGAVYFSKNGTWQNSGDPTSGASKTGAAFTWTGGSLEYVFGTAQYNGSKSSHNWGQRAWTYSAPSGFKALCTTNLTDPTITDPSTVMDVALWTGTGSSQTVPLGFDPDLIWTKTRSNAVDHKLVDVVRGFSKYLEPNTTRAELTDANGVTGSSSSGFTVGTSTDFNASSRTYVGWTWDAGSSTASNTDGTVTSSVRVNTSAGFSIVSWTNSNNTSPTANTVGHGLGVIPDLVIVKSRGSSVTWIVKSEVFSNPVRDELYLDTTGAIATAGVDLYYRTSSVLGFRETSIGGNGDAMIAYCWSAVAGYSAFGSYTGNGSTDGPFVYTGFEVKYLLAKRAVGGNGDWIIQDITRTPGNGTGDNNTLVANVANSEDGYYTAGQVSIDYLSNGFKLRHGGGPLNDSGSTYIWAAFAESPFKFANAR